MFRDLTAKPTSEAQALRQRKAGEYGVLLGALLALLGGYELIVNGGGVYALLPAVVMVAGGLYYQRLANDYLRRQ